MWAFLTFIDFWVLISILPFPHTSQSGSVVLAVSCCSMFGKNVCILHDCLGSFGVSVVYFCINQVFCCISDQFFASGFCAVVIIVLGWDKLLKKNNCYFILMHHVHSVGISVAFFIACNFHITACNSEVGFFGVYWFLSSEITFLLHHTPNNFIRLIC